MGNRYFFCLIFLLRVKYSMTMENGEDIRELEEIDLGRSVCDIVLIMWLNLNYSTATIVSLYI